MNAATMHLVIENAERVRQGSNKNVGELIAVVFHEEKSNIRILRIAIGIEFV